MTFLKEPMMTRAVFEQDEDTSSTRSGHDDQTLEVEIVFVAGDRHADGNPERYFVITTERWAFNSIEDLVVLLKKAGAE